MIHSKNDVVVFIPGFLGFEGIFNVHYFGRVVARKLEGFLRKRRIATQILVSDTLPAARLERRKERLVRWLERNVIAGRTSPPRIHLVGHSTGGVDAYALLAGLRSCASSNEDEELRAVIRSVVTLASPMRGASIVVAPEVRNVRGPAFPLRALHLLEPRSRRAILTDPMALAVFPHVASRPLDIIRYLHEIATDHQLLDDLAPDAMEQGMMKAMGPRSDHVSVAHYVTIAANSWTEPSEPTCEASLYADFLRLVRSGQRNVRTDARVRGWSEIEMRIRQSELVGSGEGRASVMSATAIASDGVVDSALQFVRAEDIHGVVVGDHLDVVGHYGFARGTRTLRHPLFMRRERGFLHSGSGFDDRAFDALWSSIAGVIAPCIARGV